MSVSAAQPEAALRESALLAWTCRLVIVVSTALSIARLMEAEPLQSANDRSRWCTVRSLVELGTYQIDQARQVPGWDTIDLVKHEEHFYSTKPPLLATLVAGLYWAIRNTLGWTLGNDLEATARLILCLINVFPFAIALTLLLRLVRRSALANHASGFAVVLTALTAGFGTLLLPFITTFNNHTPGAVSVVLCLYAVSRIVRDGRATAWQFASAGFWAAFAFTCELPAAALLAAVGGWLLLFSARRTLLWFVPAAIVPLAAFFATNWLVTGGLMPFYSSYGSEKYEFVHEGVPSYWMQPRGIDRNLDSFPMYVLHSVIGHHGLLSLSPIFVLTLCGWWRAVRALFMRLRSREPFTATLAGFAPLVHVLGAALTAIVFTFYMTRTQNYNYGGVSVALRWMLWLAPFWLLAIPVAFEHWEPGKTSRSLIGAALAVSVFSAWHPWNGPWKHPWLFQVLHNAGWIDYSDPPVQLDSPIRAWINRLPDAPLRDVEYWIELTGRDVAGQRVALRIADGGPESIDGSDVRIVEIAETRGIETTLSRYAVNVARFAGGAGPAGFLVWETAPTEDVRSSSARFWSGVPAEDVSYRAAAQRYLRLPLRTDAFRCIQAVAQAAETDEGTGETTRHRCDVWVCDELPFGVAQVETQILDLRRQLLTRQRLTVTAAGKTLDE